VNCFKYKPKTEIHLLQSLRFLFFFVWLKCGNADTTFINIMQSYCSVYCFFPVWRGIIWSKCCNFCWSTARQEPTIFVACQLASLTEGLPARSGHENLNRFHLWRAAHAQCMLCSLSGCCLLHTVDHFVNNECFNCHQVILSICLVSSGKAFSEKKQWPSSLFSQVVQKHIKDRQRDRHLFNGSWVVVDIVSS